MNESLPAIKISMTLASDQLSTFFPLLQQGLQVKTNIGSTIMTMLCEHFGVDSEYVEGRIKTIFLDGKPVDDLDTTIIEEGSTIALSAAMPGLAGATLRRGSYLAAFRNQITYRENKTNIPQKDGLVILKLFNLLVAELGPPLLKKGVYFQREDFEAFWPSLSEEFWQACREVKLNGQNVSPKKILETMRQEKHGLVMLQVDFEEKPSPVNHG